MLKQQYIREPSTKRDQQPEQEWSRSLALFVGTWEKRNEKWRHRAED